ncbi:MAG: alpha/beta hydrolase [Acidimicrobiales bacterium]
METVKVGDIELCYGLDGKADAPVLLMFCGLGGQLTSAWDQGFVDRLIEAGFATLRFDNRDAGLSTSFDSSGPSSVDIPESSAEVPVVDPSTVPYTLVDMAADGAGLLDALGIDAVHVLGVSMGGMIAQQFAISFPARTLSLCSISSMPGEPESEMPTDAALHVLVDAPPHEREAYVENQVEVWHVLGSHGYPFHEDLVRVRAGAAYDRSFRPDGVGRQLVAILASPPRTEGLRQVNVPTLVIHGEDDPLVRLSGGRATAAAVRGCRLLTFPGMGHDLPPELWDQFVEAITLNAKRADAS